MTEGAAPETETTTTTMDPVAFTRARLSEIGEVWVGFAKQQVDAAKQQVDQAMQQAEAYKDKLPDPIKQYLQPKPAEATEAPAEPTESEAA